MSQQGMRTFSTEFKEAVVLRLEAGERLASVADELEIRRKLLYAWRAAYRRLGAAGLNRKRGRGYSGSPVRPAPQGICRKGRATHDRHRQPGRYRRPLCSTPRSGRYILRGPLCPTAQKL